MYGRKADPKKVHKETIKIENCIHLPVNPNDSNDWNSPPNVGCVEMLLITYLCILMQSNFKDIAVGLSHNTPQEGKHNLYWLCANRNTETSSVNEFQTQ